LKILRNILILLTIIALAAYLVCAAVFVSPLVDGHVCQRVEARILDSDEYAFIDEKDIVAQLGRMHQKYIGVSFDKIDCQQVEDEIAKNPFVRSVACYYTASGALRIDVQQRRPKFRVMTPYGNYYIDDTRHRMPTSTRFSVYVPVVTGFADDAFLCGDFYDFIEQIEKDDFWANQITQIRIFPNYELSLTPRVGNHTIRLGKLDNADQKLEKMRTFYRKGLPYIGWNRYSTIDLRYRNQVVCTKRQN